MRLSRDSTRSRHISTQGPPGSGSKGRRPAGKGRFIRLPCAPWPWAHDAGPQRRTLEIPLQYACCRKRAASMVTGSGFWNGPGARH
jgi:hypothetical protein